MKRGTKVAVCHDGKWGRRVQGEVVATRNGHHIKVKFPSPDDGRPVEFWARKSPAVRHRHQKMDKGIVSWKKYVSWGGWADIQWFVPWFSVSKWPK